MAPRASAWLARLLARPARAAQRSSLAAVVASLAACSAAPAPAVIPSDVTVTLPAAPAPTASSSPLARQAKAEPATSGVWLSDEQQASAEARSRSRPLLVMFCADWAFPCQAGWAKTLADPAVEAELRRFVLLHVDLTSEDEPRALAAVEKYKVKGIPTLVLLDSRQRRVGTLTSAPNPEELLRALAGAR